MTKEIISNILFVAVISAMGTAWYFGWVKPNTERMYSIMDCMNDIGDRSEEGYRICVERLNEAG